MSSRPDEKPARLPVQQLAILSICRFAEPVALTGVFPYLPEMIRSFNVPDDDVAQWAGLTSMVFSLAQAVTSIQWGRASDKYGRKPVILIALTCAMLTSLTFGFSQNLTMAIIVRALAGASNGNVGILRTTVAELVPQRSLQPMAFSIMPMIWAIGSSVGPILGGGLAVPNRQYPGIFGGNAFFEKFPFALPNIVASIFFTVGIVTGFLYLRETLESKVNRKDYGLMLGRALSNTCTRRRGPMLKSSRQDTENEEDGIPTSPAMARMHSNKLPNDDPPRWKDVFSYQSNLNIVAYTILAFHAVTFDQLVPVFLFLPHESHSDPSSVQLPFKFSGGFGLGSGRIGLLFTAMGIFGIICQFAVFPPVTRRYGSLACFRVVTFVIPFVYVALPYTVLLQTDTARQAAIFALMIVKSLFAVFAFPCTTILLTNSATSVKILGTLNGVAVATSAIGRATGPFVGGGSFTWGAKRGYVVVPWFILAVFAVLGHISTWWLIEMDGPSGNGNDAAIPAGDESEDDEEEIMLLPNDAEANSGQATGLIIPGQDDTVRDRSEQAYVEDDDEDAGEGRPLLAAATMPPLAKTLSRESRINWGGTSISRRNSSTHVGRRLSSSPTVRREARGRGQGLGLTLEGDTE